MNSIVVTAMSRKILLTFLYLIRAMAELILILSNHKDQIITDQLSSSKHHSGSDTAFLK